MSLARSPRTISARSASCTRSPSTATCTGMLSNSKIAVPTRSSDSNSGWRHRKYDRHARQNFRTHVYTASPADFGGYGIRLGARIEDDDRIGEVRPHVRAFNSLPSAITLRRAGNSDDREIRLPGECSQFGYQH